MAKLYPIGIQNFEKIRREGYLYIDKTALVCRIGKNGFILFPEPSPSLWQESADIYS